MNSNHTHPTEPIYAPEDWGTVKSNTHYAWIDNTVYPIRPSKNFVKYKGRWRAIETDESGATYLEYPGVSVFFEILEFDKPLPTTTGNEGAEFTPGPWSWSERGEVSDIPSSKSSIPFSIHKEIPPSAVAPIADIVNFPPASESQTATQRANAQLIAASPDLYNALKELLYWYHQVSSGMTTKNYDIVDTVKAALFKANKNYKP